MKNIGLYSIITLVLAVLGISVPILWDLWKSYAAIEVQHIQTTNLTDSSKTVSKLEYRFDGQTVPNLSEATIVVVNNGRTPIRSEDVKSPLTIKLPPSAKILEYRIESKYPKDLVFSTDKTQAPNELTLSFPLLNPNDAVRFSVLFSGDAGNIEATARISGVSKISVIDKSDETRRVPKKFTFVTFLLLTGCFACIALWNEMKSSSGYQERFLTAVHNNEWVIPTGITGRQLFENVRIEAPFFLGTELNKIEAQLGASVLDASLTASNLEAIKRGLVEILSSGLRFTSVGADIFFGLLVIGIFVFLHKITYLFEPLFKAIYS